HARALLTTDVPASRADASVRVELDGIAPWRPALPRVAWDTASEAAHMLRAVVTTLGTPRGLARLLHDDGGHDESIVARAAPHVRALVSACTHDDARAAVDAARPLLGLGDGLTPSGDDFIGGVLFARRLCGVIDPAWDTA